jgi:hypothetical protein
MRNGWIIATLVALAARLGAQDTGAIAGQVRDSVSGRLLRGVVVTADSPHAARTAGDGRYRLAALAPGWHRVTATATGFEAAVRESVLVATGQTTTLDFLLRPLALPLAPVIVSAEQDSVLDPRAAATAQQVTQAELRRLPVSSLDEGIALSAGAVGESYRGGRLGEQSLTLDGLGLKNQLDASTGELGIRIPPDIIASAALVTDAFSARFGQAISGLVNVVTRDGGSRWHGRAAYENDRPLPEGWDYGLDRLTLAADGPLVGKLRLLGAVDATGRLDADPVSAPAAPDPRDPRAASPWLFPHNSGETYDGAVKLTAPFGAHETLRLFAVRSVEQRLLFDAAFKYDPSFAPASRLTGSLWSGDWQHASLPDAPHALTLDLHVGSFTREFMRGTLDTAPRYRFGGFTNGTFHFAGELIARAEDTSAARGALAGFTRPEFSERTPWGVPAFFLADGSRGDIGWYRFRDTRGQLDARLRLSADVDLLAGGLVAAQRVQSFSRLLGYLPVGDSVPAAATADFSPRTGAAYVETQCRAGDLVFTFGLRYDQFDPHAPAQGSRPPRGARRAVSPRLAVSTVLRKATLVASYGRFNQAPDFQYLVDAAFDDTARTGRFRRGNPDLGFEGAAQYAFSLRARPSPWTALRVNLYARRLQGLVSSVPLGEDPDSSIFGNTDFGTVKGVELMGERELRDWWGVRASYVFQSATATATNAFELLHRLHIDSLTGATLPPGHVEFPLDFDRRHSLIVVLQARVTDSARVPPRWLLRGLEGGVVARYSSGLPYSRTNAAGDTILGLPNSERLPAQVTADVLLRRPLALGGRRGSLYLDVRNLLGRRNIVAVRRTSGQPTATTPEVQALATAAYNAHPEPIPYESPRYRGWADLNHNGYVEGTTELMPLYLAAARDVTQPLFAYGAPRLVRLGMEFLF